ncbi:MAG: AbrB/MazE/SpoVT family DNA-binding domain-containing protein, partial [Promethearchaeota archaeon]
SEARKLFNINPGDQLLVFGDKKKGIGLIKATILKKFASQLFQIFEMEKEKESKENDDKNEEI